MSEVRIMIDNHPSEKGFQLSATSAGKKTTYPDPIPDIKDALRNAFYLKSAIEHESGITIPDLDILISQDSLEHNALLTPNNIKAYRGIMTGKVRVIHDPR